MKQQIHIGDQLTIEIKRMGINGEGIGYFNRLAIFVDHALPQEKIEVTITEVYDNRAVGIISRLIEKSKDRREPFCKVYETCGGCQTQHLDYQQTLEQKRELIKQSFERYINIHIDEKIIKDTIGAKNPKHYRNKASLPVQLIRHKNVFGMYAKASNQFVQIDDCPIQHPLINHILNTLISLMDQFQMHGIDPKNKRGYVRALVVRVSEFKQQGQVSFIMQKKSKYMDSLVEQLIELEPSIVSVFEVISSNPKKGFFTDEMRLVYGVDTIEEDLSDMHFLLKPEAFFQLNTPQAHQFYLEMKRLANLKPHETAIDAYAGIAPVSHYMHQDAKHIYAIEIDPSACESARLSLKKNGIENVTVLQSDFKRALSGLKEKKIDVMFFDPPRIGLTEETIALILSFRPSRLIYGSCNPSTLAKDLNTLLHDYQLIETVPIDMFPYTSLVESVSLLVLKT